MSKRVERTRNGGTWTEARYFSQIRSFLRQGFQFWVPATNALNKRKRKYEGPDKRRKFEYQCDECGGWFPRKEIQKHHKVPVGSIKSLDDVKGFIERLTPESEEMFSVVCKKCHLAETNKQR